MEIPSEKINKLESEISQLEAELSRKKAELAALQKTSVHTAKNELAVSKNSSPNEKIKLFRSLFRGREDVFALRFESKKTGKSGYQPACRNEWVSGVCGKPQTKCKDCSNKDYFNITDDEIKFHLTGEKASKPFIMGIYPLLTDETCWFLALDFDKEQWKFDTGAFLDTCAAENLPAYLERSRSGNGGHVWFFFNERIEASLARKVGSALITKNLDIRPEIGLDSFDRFFPNQDTIPRGGFGNLIALPLQKKAREKNHSIFIDRNFAPYPDQWAFLYNVKKIKKSLIEDFVQKAQQNGELLPVGADFSSDIAEETPWELKRQMRYPEIDETLPKKIDITLSNQIFIDFTGLPPVIINRILRLASFSNPEFYQAQRMRLPTWDKPRILYLYERFPKHIAIPIGCINELKALLEHYNITPIVADERNHGVPIDVEFIGKLKDEQIKAANELLKYETGVLSATTAFGKTVIALWLIAQRKVNTLILVHRKQLMEQWVERISQFFEIPIKEIGQFGGGKKKRNGKLDIAVIQSVSRNGVVQDWIQDYGQVIVDECHHISAYSFEQIIRKSNAYYKVGLSATVQRKDGQHPIIFMNLGKIRYSVNARKQALERSFEHRVLIRRTQLTVDNKKEYSIQDLFTIVYQNENRNRQIISDIIKLVSSQKQILLLSERIEHLNILYSLLEPMNYNLFLLKGGLGKKQLKKIFNDINQVKEGCSRIILSTGKYLGEGIDMPFLDTLLLTFPVSWRGTLSQYAGRLHRDYHGKEEVLIYDYADLNVPVLSRMHAKRLKGYETLGYSVDQEII
ncbi:MAG: DEAD/DEAH box helicase [Spirochaetales bacterium]|nr:DEAD/DEAH box helicase [Spirochaetales bacterium]